jgi:DNA modification methylase
MVGGDMEGDAVSEVHLLQGDCVEVMKTLESDSVGLFVFSPPYNCRKPYTTSKDEMPWDVYYLWMEDVLSECYRIMEKGGVIAVNVPTVIRWQAVHEYASSWSDYDPDYKSHRDGKQVLGKGRIEPIGIRLFGMMEAMGLKMREPIVWVKGSEGNAICSDYRMGCDSDPYMRPAHELILLGSKGQWFHRGGTGRRGREAVPFMDYTKDVWHISPDKSKKHPAPFPEELPTRVIQLFTHAKDAVVCDPFMGKGTSGAAAVKLGRSFTGIELSPEYFQLAERHITDAQMVTA